MRFEKDPNRKENYVSNLRRAIDSETRSTRSIKWRTELLGLVQPEERAKIYQDGKTLGEQLMVDEKKLLKAAETDDVGEFSGGFERSMVASYITDLAKAAQIGPEDLAKVLLKAVEVARVQKIPPKRIGPAMRSFNTLFEAKLYSEAEGVARGILHEYPQNFDIKRRLSRVLNAQGKFDESVKFAAEALKSSYGRNEFWAVEELARGYVGIKQIPKAKELLQAYVGKIELESPMLKAERGRLNDLLKSIQN